MKAATHSKRHYEETKLLVVKDCGEKILHTKLRDFADFFEAGDILAVNTSATLPSSFSGTLEKTGEFIELRLAGFQGTDLTDYRRWKAVSFGLGDWRQPTEIRGPAPRVATNDVVKISETLKARITFIDENFYRLLDIEFTSPNLMADLFASGRPIQYSYLSEELKVWDQQTLLSTVPISVEPPSASFSLNWSLMFKLQNKGVNIVPLIHSAGLSSTGDENFDKVFPLDEFYQISPESIQKIQMAKSKGHKIFAAGTTVTRALESAFLHPQEVVPTGRTKLKLNKNSQMKIVDVLLTGMHEEGTSHASLMSAFCPHAPQLITHLLAQTDHYRSHEFGDLTLLFR